MNESSLSGRIINRTGRVPAPVGVSGDGAAVARQLDVALMQVGFKLSSDLLRYLSSMHPVAVKEIGKTVLDAVRQSVGDHVQHNTYFRDFPDNVPDTYEFWTKCIVDALLDPASAGKVSLQLSIGTVNLLDLPKYGRYQHSYEDMLSAHDAFIPSVKDRVTILILGKPLAGEALDLYLSLASSPIPLSETDRSLLADLAEVCLNDPQPESIPMRENRALINQVRLHNGHELLVDTVTDVLRLATALSEGDVTLETATRFGTFPRRTRRALIAGLDKVVTSSPAKIADVNAYREEWKRLGERLHPHEFLDAEGARDVFAVARGEKTVRSLAARVEVAFAGGRIREAISILRTAPGLLFRNLDRILRSANEAEVSEVLGAVESVIDRVPGPLILSTREHFQNRVRAGAVRIFSNRKGKAWVEEENRDALDNAMVDQLLRILDSELLHRLPALEHLVVDPEVLTLALPLSDKSKPGGFGIVPRGSTVPVADDILRVFAYWRQQRDRTDYDLSVLLLDEDFIKIGQTSWTNLRDPAGLTIHSGDITEAPHGATEFIDVDLLRHRCRYVVPQVNIYDGESFTDVAESFFGFMDRARDQNGKPFEPATVRVKSDLRGRGRVALPVIIAKAKDGSWSARWLHLYLTGKPRFNRVEANRVTAALLARSAVEREFLTLDYLVGLLRLKTARFSWHDPSAELYEPVAFIGMQVPEGLPEGSRTYTLRNLAELLPA